MKKIFKKFNIVDLIILIMIILFICFFLYRFVIDKDNNLLEKDVVVSLCAPEIADYVVQNMHVGDKVIEDEKEIFIGTVTDVLASDPVKYLVNNQGITSFIMKEGYNSVKVKVSARAIASEYGIVIDGVPFAIGYEWIIHVGTSVWDFNICGIDFVE